MLNEFGVHVSVICCKQVEKAFMFGFPTDWEQHAEKYCGEDSKTGTASQNTLFGNVSVSLGTSE